MLRDGLGALCPMLLPSRLSEFNCGRWVAIALAPSSPTLLLPRPSEVKLGQMLRDGFCAFVPDAVVRKVERG